MSLGMGWLNVGSLGLGLLAWLLPVAAMVWPVRGKPGAGRLIALVASPGCCAVALCLQIHYSNYLVEKADFGSQMDIHGAVTLVSTVLVVVTLALNALLVARLCAGRANRPQ